MGGWCRDTDGVVGGHIVAFILYFLAALLFLALRVVSPTPPHTHELVLHARTHTHLQKYTYKPVLLEPPESSDQGVSPPNRSSHLPIPSPPHAHTQHTHTLILLCHSILSESATKRTVKKKDREEKKGGKEYRLSFRAPRGPLSSIRNEKAAKHQPYPVSPAPPLPVSLGSFVHEESDIMAL